MRVNFFVLVAVFAWLAAGPVDAASRDVILHPGQILDGRFIQERRLSGFPQPLKSEGRFVVAPGRGMLWQVETPIALVTVITPTGVYQSGPDGAVTALPASPAATSVIAQMQAMMAAVLAGDWSVLDERFAVAKTGAGSGGWERRLVPLNPSEGQIAQIQEIRLKGGRFVEQVEIVRSDSVAEEGERLWFRDQSVRTGPLSAADSSWFDGRRP